MALSFNKTFNLEKLIKDFDKKDNNAIFVSEIYEIIRKKYPSNYNEKYKEVLYSSINNKLYLLNVDGSRIDNDNKRYELFHHKLSECGNSFELVAREIWMRVNNPSILSFFIDEVFDIIHRFFTECYFLVFQLGMTDDLKAFETLWNALRLDKNPVEQLNSDVSSNNVENNQTVLLPKTYIAFSDEKGNILFKTTDNRNKQNSFSQVKIQGNTSY